ncbi:MAG: DUF488 family protein [Candidatus Pacebacteria bacterium]|nr:DUF488 family protein [Candidatus Paceibacterota bacterium]MDR3583215.1 DUF488 family protein [Candidatus Paceibacterota bacterium]
MLKTKRIYEKPEKSDGTRVLVDRLWPRGVKKEEALIDLWLKEAAPSLRLRQWYAHDPRRWQDFKKKYFRELKDKNDLTKKIASMNKRHVVTLLFAAKEERMNQADALKQFIEKNY